MKSQNMFAIFFCYLCHFDFRRHCNEILHLEFRNNMKPDDFELALFSIYQTLSFLFSFQNSVERNKEHEKRKK